MRIELIVKVGESRRKLNDSALYEQNRGLLFDQHFLKCFNATVYYARGFLFFPYINVVLPLFFCNYYDTSSFIKCLQLHKLYYWKYIKVQFGTKKKKKKSHSRKLDFELLYFKQIIKEKKTFFGYNYVIHMNITIHSLKIIRLHIKK